MKKLIVLVVLCLAGFILGFTTDANAETVHIHAEVDANHARCTLLTWGLRGKIETHPGQALDVTFNVSATNPPIGIAMRCNGRLLAWNRELNARLQGFRSLLINDAQKVWQIMAPATVSVADTSWLIAIPPTNSFPSVTTTTTVATSTEILPNDHFGGYSWIKSTIPTPSQR